METERPLLTELSFAFILPTIMYIFFASSSVWASGNLFWTSFYEFLIEPSRIHIFNFWAGIIFLGGTFIAFSFALTALISDLINSKSTTKGNVFAISVSGMLLISLLLFYSGINIFSIILN